MRPDLVVLPPELLDEDLRIDPILEPLHAQALVPELAIEGFVRSVLLRLAGVDVSGVDICFHQPAQDCSGDELRTVVGSEIARSTVRTHELGKNLDDSAGADAAGHVDRQTFARVLICRSQYLI